MSRRGPKRAPALGRKVKPGPLVPPGPMIPFTGIPPAVAHILKNIVSPEVPPGRHAWPEWVPGTPVTPGPMIPFMENPAAAGHMLQNIFSPVNFLAGPSYTHVFTTPADAVDEP